MPIRSKYVKIYTVEVDRLPKESGRWYFQHKGELFNCILVLKQVHGSCVASPQFLVIDSQDGEFNVPVIVKTIRPIDCKIVQEQVIEHPMLYDLNAIFGINANKEVKEMIMPLMEAV